MKPFIKDIKIFKNLAEKFDFEPHAMGFCKKVNNHLIHISSKGNIYCYFVEDGNYIQKTRFKMLIQDILDYVGWRKD